MRGQRMVKERSEYSLTVLSTGSARAITLFIKAKNFGRFAREGVLYYLLLLFPNFLGDILSNKKVISHKLLQELRHVV